MKNKFYAAFTLLELIMVIIVVGILAALAIPKIDKKVMIEATNQVASHIRYAQHLAMLDDKFNPTDPAWFSNRWSIKFNNTNYSICFNACNTANNIAKDPKNSSKLLSSDTTIALTTEEFNRDLDLKSKFDITNVSIAGGCRENQIAFDKKGRPFCYPANLGGLTNPASSLITEDVNITLTNSAGENAIITIYKETGFVEIATLP